MASDFSAFRAHTPPPSSKPRTMTYPNLEVIISNLGSFSTAYNIVNISLVLLLMDGLYPLSESHKSLCASTMFAGTRCSICGPLPPFPLLSNSSHAHTVAAAPSQV